MSEENLGDALDNEYKQHQKEIAIKTLGGRTHLTISKIAKLLEHKEHGATIGAITLDELLVAKNGVSKKGSPVGAAPVAAKAPKAAKEPKAPKAAKEPKAAKAPKEPKEPKAAKAGAGTKPRLNRDVAFKEVKAALKSLKGNVSNGDLVQATKYTPVQIRTFLNELIEAGDVTYEGKGRGTKYSLA